MAELGISCGLMVVILFSTNRAKLARLTGVFAGLLVATYVVIESPVSGMSMNPARTFGPALAGWLWTGL